MLDYLGIFRKFNRKKIKYIVVGGLAVNLYSILCITYDIEGKNLKKFLALMKEWKIEAKAQLIL